MSFQISLASRYVSTLSLTEEFSKKKRKAEEESSTLISKYVDNYIVWKIQ